MASNNGSVLISCATTLAIGLIQPCTRLDYLPPRASLITSSADHPKKTKSQVSVHVSRKESTVFNHKGIVSKVVKSKNEIFENYSDDLNGIGCFPGSPYHIQIDPSVTPKQTLCCPIPVHLKEFFSQKRLTRYYKQEF